MHTMAAWCGGMKRYDSEGPMLRHVEAQEDVMMRRYEEAQLREA